MLFLVVAGFLLYWERLKDLATTVTALGPTEMVQEEPTTAEETSFTLEEEPTIAEEASAGSPEEESGVRVFVSVVSAEGVGISVLEDGQLTRGAGQATSGRGKNADRANRCNRPPADQVAGGAHRGRAWTA